MALSVGTKLGPYEIVAPIGAGGMGEVWKARDSRLDRIVAIKRSNEEFSERFEREARAVAAMNHPKHLYAPRRWTQLPCDGVHRGHSAKRPVVIDKAIEYSEADSRCSRCCTSEGDYAPQWRRNPSCPKGRRSVTRPYSFTRPYADFAAGTGSVK